jgi:hypothetical protein
MTGLVQRWHGLKWLGALALLALVPSGASAALVDFSTVSSLLSCGGASNCSPATGNVINFGLSTGGPARLQVTYSANIENDLNVAPISTANFGQLFLLCVSCAGQTGSFDLSQATLAINFNQGPDPFTDSGSFGTGTFSGALTVNDGNFGGSAYYQIPGAPAMFSLIGGSDMITYIVQQTPNGNSVSINSATTLQGLVLLEEAPVTVAAPSVLPLLASGLGLIVVLGRRRNWQRGRPLLDARGGSR